MLCMYAAQSLCSYFMHYENYLYVVGLAGIPDDITVLRGKYGLFFEYTVHGVQEIMPEISEKVQTCAVYGIEPEELAAALAEGCVQGIDRIVPVGHTLDMDIFWDGHDIIGELSRCIICKT